MQPFPVWADLPRDLLRRISGRLDLQCHASARGACKAWRRALAPLSPCLLLINDTAVSLPTGLSFNLPGPGYKDARCVGSSNGWLAYSLFDLIVGNGREITYSLFHPITATEIWLPPLTYRGILLPKLVFAPNPSRHDFAAVVICDADKLAYVTTRAKRWAIHTVSIPQGDQLVDIVHGKHAVYCLTRRGNVNLLHLPAWRHPIILHEHATVEPLLSLPFDPTAGFDTACIAMLDLIGAKNLVFCEDDNLYQIWRNTSSTFTAGGGSHRVQENAIFVLRYFPERQPCWQAVTDLGGYSVFVGKNNAVSTYAKDVPGLKGNCVYWIGGRGRDQGMVFDMQTRMSKPCLPLPTQRAICWFFTT